MSLQELEYAIRVSMPVREDQEDPANPQHLTEALRYGIKVTADLSKGDLLALVQSRIRSGSLP